ncbi:MAG TPA: Gfo/Idh/MocA family oxidoreductase [Polyangia bacterium]|nr:Gfo/Idh/MocA family oxidoreductase [Polyangia bacterium]
MRDKLQWGVIGTGQIASDLALALETSTRCRIVNAAGSSPEKARGFAAHWRLPRAAASVDELVADPGVDVVYVATPHPAHEAHALAAIAAGKPVLCEKPLTMDAAGAARVIEAARARGVFLMEAFMYRCHPLVRALVQRLQDGVIGPILHVRAEFGFRKERDPAGRLYNVALGGGAILDVGCYPASFARLVAGIAAGFPFAEPTKLDATGHLGPTGADELASALLTFASGVTATLGTAIHHATGRSAMILGEAGSIEMPDPWAPESRRHGHKTGFTIHRDGHAPELVAFETKLDSYALEAELVADALPALEAPWPAMTPADTLGNMKLLDAWQAAVRSGPSVRT